MISRRVVLTSLLAAIVIAGCSKPAVRPDGKQGPLPVGSIAPDVVATDAQNNEVRLSALKGHPAVVYFYPKDGTPGCTTEACAFRDAWSKYEKANVTVIGVSADSAESHAEFRREQHLPFPLAADPNGSIATSYGVGKAFFGYDRVTFLIDGDGKVARYWPDVDPGVHAGEVLAAAESLGH